MKRDRGGEEQRERDLSEETALAGGGDAEQKKRRGGGRSGFENGGRGGDGESSPTVCRLLLARRSFAPRQTEGEKRVQKPKHVLIVGTLRHWGGWFHRFLKLIP